MHETEVDIGSLQELLDRTLARRFSSAAMRASTSWPVWCETYGSSPFEWSKSVVFIRIDPTSMWAYAFNPELFPE